MPGGTRRGLPEQVDLAYMARIERAGNIASRGLLLHAAQQLAQNYQPLAARMRPRRLDEVVGQDHLVGPEGILSALLRHGEIHSVILWGPPGTGKTTIAQLMAEASGSSFIELSAVSAGVSDLRSAIADALRLAAEQQKRTLLFVDEMHHLNRVQQDVLLPAIEQGVLGFVGATTENPFFEVISPLTSRSTVVRLRPLEPTSIGEILRRAGKRIDVDLEPPAVEELAKAAGGDARVALGLLEVAVALAKSESSLTVRLSHAQRARETSSVRHGRNDHYEMASALIKSIRGSDPDAGLFWLERLLAAGEDPIFIARRLVILASEDIGLADHTSLLVATAAARAVEIVGLPEAAINLAHAVIHLAAAPKSNSVVAALSRARKDAEAFSHTEVPPHLRNSHIEEATYLYPHDYPGGFVHQAYRPREVSDPRRGDAAHYYRPNSDRERSIAERLAKLWEPSTRPPEPD